MTWVKQLSEATTAADAFAGTRVSGAEVALQTATSRPGGHHDQTRTKREDQFHGSLSAGSPSGCKASGNARRAACRWVSAGRLGRLYRFFVFFRLVGVDGENRPPALRLAMVAGFSQSLSQSVIKLLNSTTLPTVTWGVLAEFSNFRNFSVNLSSPEVVFSVEAEVWALSRSGCGRPGFLPRGERPV